MIFIQISLPALPLALVAALFAVGAVVGWVMWRGGKETNENEREGQE